MEKSMRAVIATENSQRAMTPFYSAGGRVYQFERDPAHAYDKPVGKVVPGHGFPSLTEIKKVDYLLTYGVRMSIRNSNEGKKMWPAPLKNEELIVKYGLSFSHKMQRYTRSADELWEAMKETGSKYINENNISSYGELVYRATYR
jgi:hypothetical protein